MNHAPITVIIPTHDRANKLLGAINSVLNQTLPVEKTIVVDDGSTDNTASLIAPFTNDKFIYIHQSQQGVSAARNRAVVQASSPWVAFLDSDDLWLRHKIEKQWAAIVANPGIKLHHCDERWIRNGQHLNPMKKHNKAMKTPFKESLERCMISPSSAIIDRSLLISMGGFDETLPACEDYDLWLRICASYPIFFLPEQLLIKNGGHSDQLSRQFWGMDRFRIQAMENLLQSSILTSQQLRWLYPVLIKKINIVLQGAKKRGHQAIIDDYEHKLLTHQARMRQCDDCSAR